ncbi:hypothetical protein DB345_21260 [Spartobacteria bacterium LR76]|nr:hypothetical protein DB345_21260 [Spartobacteria bacterium LR76]
MMSEAVFIDTLAGRARLARTNRRTLAISVLPDGSLELVAPLDTSEAEILRRVEKRNLWITKQRRRFSEWEAEKTPRRYVTGATHRYLGRQYRLRIQVGAATGLVLRGGFLDITVRSRADEEVKRVLEEWYRRRAAMQFQKRLERWKEWCSHRGLPIPTLRVRIMAKRWGSARPDGTILLNPELVRAASTCIDYVIAHEVCHLKYPNHGPRFRNLLQSLCPDHAKLKARLEQMD